VTLVTANDPRSSVMPFITTSDDVEIFYKDWGAGQPVVFSHGWPRQSDSWEAQQLHLADNGFRAIAADLLAFAKSA
jgi:non-heme chloroperoxidase